MKRGGGTIGPIVDDISVKLLTLIKAQTEPLANTKDSDASFHEYHNTVFMHVLSMEEDNRRGNLAEFISPVDRGADVVRC